MTGMAWHHRMAGKLLRRVWRITRPRTLGVRAILLDPDDRIALVRHTYTDHWYLPGGGVKKGESTLAAIRRELREEVAIDDARFAALLGVYHATGEGKDDHVVIYVARTVTRRGDALEAADTIEIAQARWFALDALPDDLSPATKRRIAEYRGGGMTAERW